MKTPAEMCKEAGLKSLTELAELLNNEVPIRTLQHWATVNKPTAFKAILLGAVELKKERPAIVFSAQEQG